MTIVTAKWIACSKKREIKAGEIPQGEQPMLDECFMPMVAEKAVSKS